MIKALIITYNFPPDVMGVRRILKWIEYLPSFDIFPIILTVKYISSSDYDFDTLDYIRQKRIPVFRSGSFDPYRLKFIAGNIAKKKSMPPPQKDTSAIGKNTLDKKIMGMLRKWIFLPDDRCGWIPFAVIKGLKIISKYKPDIIISTSYPNSAHVVGLIIKKLTGIKWVADFRDGWSQNPTFFSYATPLHDKISGYMENKVVKNADFIITVSPPITKYLKNLCPLNPEKFNTIFNGYDPADFRFDENPEKNIRLPDENPEKRIFKLIYTGTFYGNRSPQNFFIAVKEILESKIIPENKMKIIFYSQLNEEYAELIKKNSLQDIVELKGFLPYKKCLYEQSKASALLLFLPKEKNTEIMVTQKVFEYLYSGKPVIAIIPDGACKEVLKETGGAVFADPENPVEIKSAIIDIYNKWKTNQINKADNSIVSKYTRENQAKLLSGIINKICR